MSAAAVPTAASSGLLGCECCGLVSEFTKAADSPRCESTEMDCAATPVARLAIAMSPTFLINGSYLVNLNPVETRCVRNPS